MIATAARPNAMASTRTKAQAAFDEFDVTGSICRDSFFEFVKEFWSVISQEEPVWNWHIKYLCDLFQSAAERVFKGLPKEKDIIVNISPGTTKSTIASVMFPAWVWSRMPQAKTICASHTHELVLDLSRKCRDIVTCEKYQKCFKTITLRDDQNTKGYFANTEGGMRFCCTIGGKTPMGMHAHFLIVDDPIDPQKVVSEAEIKVANNFMNEVLPTRKINKAVTPTFLIMQRLHQNDPSGNRLAKPNAKQAVLHVCLPAQLADNVNPPELKANYVGGLMDPTRLSAKVLTDAEAELGQFAFSGQFRQDPVPLGGGMFKTTRLRFEPLPSDLKFRKVVRYWDKAGTAGGGAYTVGAKMGEDIRGRFWVLHVVRGQWSSEEREDVIHNTAKMDGRGVVVAVEQEPGSGGKESAENTARRLAGFRVKIDPVGQSDGNKALRADPFSVQVNCGNVILVIADWNTAYVDEMKFFPASTYKDQMDASSGAFNQLTGKRLKVGALGK
jgi:predicted phage terminase large subunit-like protein